MTTAYLLTILSAYFAGIIFIQNKKKKFPYLTLSMGIILIVCLLVQLAIPSTLLLFERNTDLIQTGQWWRIVTALFFQDGGLFGGISNIFFLGLIGFVAEQFLKKWQWLSLYFTVGIIAELVALSWQPIGAGNSIAFFGLAAAINVYIFLQSNIHSQKNLLRILNCISFVGAIVLIFEHNIHGAAFLIGCIIALCIFSL